MTWSSSKIAVTEVIEGHLTVYRSLLPLKQKLKYTAITGLHK